MTRTPAPRSRSAAVVHHVVRARYLARRASWGLVDQVLVSASSLALSVLVARNVDASAFGAFTLAFAVFAVSIAVSRTLASRPVSVRFADAEAHSFREAAGASAGTAVALGLLLGTATVVVGVVLSGTLGRCLVAVGVVLPGLLTLDNWRLVFIACGRSSRAVLVDSVWAAGLMGGVVVLAVQDVAAPHLYLLVWGTAGSAAAVVGCRLLGVRPHLRACRAWLAAHGDFSRLLLVESLLLLGAYQGVIVLIGAVGSLRDAGVLRAAQIVLGPVMLVSQSAQAFLLPELARRRAAPPSRRIAAAATVSILLSTAAASYGAVVLLLPDGVGIQLLGDSWDGARMVLPAAVVGQVAATLTNAGPALLLYSATRSRITLRLSIATASLMVAAGVTGVFVAGALGAAIGLAAVNVVLLPFWMLAAWRSEHAPGGRAPHEGTEQAPGPPE